ncbi:MAG: type II toxin-antitoxin system HicA family toxin [Vulcanococcus sp.]
MKRVDLIQQLERAGCVLLWYDGKHDKFHQPRTGMSQPVPRHREIQERLERKILKELTADL